MFGSQAAGSTRGFSFGGGGGAFGSGAPATSAPAFGFSAAGSLGAKPPASSPFGFSSAPTSTPAFGLGSTTPTPGSAFSFGGTPASAPGFSFSNTPSSTPAFGFSGATGGTGFGFGSALAPAASPFGSAGASKPLFGSATASPFGGSNTGTAAPGSTLFGGLATPASAPLAFGIGSSAAPAAQSVLGTALQPTPYLVQLQRADGGAVAGTARFKELHPASQKVLLDFEQKLLQYRKDRKGLGSDERMQDGGAMKKGLFEESAEVERLLRVLDANIEADSHVLDSFHDKVVGLIHHTQSALSLFEQCKLWRKNNSEKTGMVPLLTSTPELPSSYLKEAAAQFQVVLQQYAATLAELEAALLPSRAAPGGEVPSVPETVSSILQNLHQYFVFVASRVSTVHKQVEARKAQFLSDRQLQGDWTDPFQEAARRAALQKLPPDNMTSLKALTIPAAPLQLQADAQQAAAADTSTAATSAAPPAAGGLFGAPAVSSGSVFGSATASAAAASPPGMSSGFLQPSGTAFGTPAATSPVPGLLGTSATTSAVPGGSGSTLFGAATGSSGLFSSTTNSAPSTLARTKSKKKGK